MVIKMTIDNLFNELRQNMRYLGLITALTVACGNNEFKCPEGTQKKQMPGMDYCMNDKGKPHGPAVRMYPSGAIAARINFIDGKASGKFQSWYENEDIAIDGAFDDDKLDGLMKAWNEEGVKIAEVEFQRGKLHGRFNSWYDNGQLHEKGECEKGKPVGEWTIKYEDGTVVYGPAPANIQIMKTVTEGRNPCDSSQTLKSLSEHLL